MKWSLDDARIVGDIVAASLLARTVQLVALKAFIEPAGHFIGTTLWQRLRGLSGGRLPALPWVSADRTHNHGIEHPITLGNSRPMALCEMLGHWHCWDSLPGC